jgi:hypothetical protein
LIEAAALGALVVGSPKLLKHRIILDQLSVSTTAEAISKMESVMEDEEFRLSCQRAQDELINDICFIRPLTDLAEAMARRV